MCVLGATQYNALPGAANVVRSRGAVLVSPRATSSLIGEAMRKATNWEDLCIHQLLHAKGIL